MLRLFSHTVHVVVFADRVVLSRVGSGLARKVLHSEVLQVPAQPGLAPGAGALAALDAALHSPRWRDAEARVLVSNALVRYALLPANGQMLSPAEETSLASLRFEQALGAGAGPWDIRLSDPMTGRGQLAAALDRAFLLHLNACLEGGRLRAVSVEPFLMYVFNRSRQRLAGRDFWFANAEPGLLLLARIRNGQWESFTARAFEGALAPALAQGLREARLLARGSTFPRKLYLHATGLDSSRLLHEADLEIIDTASTAWAKPAFADLALAGGVA